MTGKEMLLQKGFVLIQKDKIDRYEKIVKDVYREEGTVVIHYTGLKKVTVESFYNDNFSSRYSGMRSVPLNKEWLELLRSLLAGEQE